MPHDAALPGDSSTAESAPELPTAPSARLRLGTRVVPHVVLAAVAVGTGLFVAVGSADSSARALPERHDRMIDSAVSPTDGSPAALAASGSTSATASRATSAATSAAPTVDHGAISALAANGIPTVALNAYRVAAARMGHVDAGCGIRWTLVAAIGRVESDHGRFGGATLHADGTSVPRTIGPALDGHKWDYIPAPANGEALAGDSKYAHALGPMQFIPSTWAAYGTDATGDGKADIFNINDAALGTARYLCAAGGDLRAAAGQKRAVLTYNHNTEYLAKVLALSTEYAKDVKVKGKPHGRTTGDLPKVRHGGRIPPANPGAPAAGGSSSPTRHPSSSPRSTTHAPRPTCTPSPSKTRTKTRTTSPSSTASHTTSSSAASSSASPSKTAGHPSRTSTAKTSPPACRP